VAFDHDEELAGLDIDDLGDGLRPTSWTGRASIWSHTQRPGAEHA